MKRLVACTVLAAGLLSVPVDTIQAASPDALEATLTALVRTRIQPLLKKQGIRRVGIGGFAGDPGLNTGAGVDIRLKLAQALEKQRFQVVNRDFEAIIRGAFYFGQDPRGTKLRGIRLEMQVFDVRGDNRVLLTTIGVNDKDAFVFGQETVPRMLGHPVELGPGFDDRQRSEAFRKSLENPPVHIQNTLIKTSPDSPYAIQVLVKSGGEYHPLPVRLENGLPRVDIRKDQVYAVRLINNSPHDAAVALSIDGLSMFRFSKKSYRYVIISPGKSALIKGWHLDNEKTQEFKVTDFPQSAAARVHLKPSSATGTICAAFSAAWQDKRPDDEPPGRGRGAATGFGKVIRQKYQEVRRTIGNVRAVITVRYTR